MFHGATRGRGTCYMGEITGQYFLFNSNAEVHMLGLSMFPSSALKLSAIAYSFACDKKEQFGANTARSDKVGNELNLIAEYAVSENIALAGVFGIFDARNGTADYPRDFVGVSAPERVDSNIHLGQVAMVVKF
jgi:hypothetical protein